MSKDKKSSSELLRDRIKEEYKKCALSPQYFLSRYCYIQHPLRGKILFDLYDYQKNTLNDFEREDYNIILKARQVGISTAVAGYATWLLLFHRDKNVLVIATKQDTAKNLVSKVKFMHDNLPVWLKGRTKANNKLSIEFTNGSQIKAVASSKDAGRSEALSLLILDECAFIDDIDIIWTAASSTLSTGGKAILLSTPNGVGNFFHKMWNGAISKENGFNPILLDWKVHPERDQEWRDKQTEIMGEVQATQEHDASFIFSGTTVIPAEILEFYKATYVQEPMSKEGVDGNFWVWEYPDPNKTYIVSADVSRGDGEDYSTAHVIDAESSTQVAEYRGKLETKQFGNLLVSIATMYNDALLIPDNSTVGWNAIQQIIDREYKNLFYMSNDMKYVDVTHQMSGKYEEKMIPGFTISSRTRPLIISRLKEYLMDNSFTIRSTRTISELETFIWKNGRAEAMRGCNDDLVMGLCIGLWVRDTALRLRQQGIELIKAAINSTNMVSSGGVYVNRDIQVNPYEMNVTGEITENIKWLL